MPEYVIHKSYRMPGTSSYFGPAWDHAGLRSEYSPRYTSRKRAEILARMLTGSGTMPFIVSEIPSGSKSWFDPASLSEYSGAAEGDMPNHPEG